MSSFQHLWSCSSWSRVQNAASFGSVNFALPVVASRTSLIDEIPWAPMIENSQPPNQPSLIPPAIGVMPFAFSVSHAFEQRGPGRRRRHAGLASTSLRTSTGNDGCTYQGAVQTFPSYVSSFAFR